jgi:CRP-like cAMP-binding protein
MSGRGHQHSSPGSPHTVTGRKRTQTNISKWKIHDRLHFTELMSKCDFEWVKWEQNAIQRSFALWKETAQKLKQLEADDLLFHQTLQILQKSKRGSRSVPDIQTLVRFFAEKVACLPPSMLSSSDLEQIANEVDYHRVIGRSLLFLQGDYGNCYYIVARGSVDLYFEASKDREMSLSRDFGALRGKPLILSDIELVQLGKKIYTVPCGAGFGEYAILNVHGKVRSCAAVAATPDSLLLVVQEGVYNACIRKLHSQQRLTTLANALLLELPLFNQFPRAKVAQMAMSLTSISCSTGQKIVSAGSPLDRVMLILSGQVRAVWPVDKVSKMHEEFTGKTSYNSDRGIAARGVPSIAKKLGELQKSLPTFVAAQLGRGSIIGELDVQQASTVFQMTYSSMSADCEIFVMPIKVYVDALESIKLRKPVLYKMLDDIKSDKTRDMKKRTSASYEVMTAHMAEKIEAEETKLVIRSALPSLLKGDVLLSTIQGRNGPPKRVLTAYPDPEALPRKNQEDLLPTTEPPTAGSPRRGGVITSDDKPLSPTPPGVTFGIKVSYTSTGLASPRVKNAVTFAPPSV